MRGRSDEAPFAPRTHPRASPGGCAATGSERKKGVAPDGTTPERLGCSAKTYATPWLALSMAVLVEFTAVSIASATSPPLKTD